jgi:hypothetical protein
MIIGDPGTWADRFKALDERLLERIAAVWPECVARLPGQPIENEITINLVDLLWKDAAVRRLCHWIEYQYEPFGIDQSGVRFSKGEIDMAAFLDQDRETYLAYECKRLNVNFPSGFQSLATDYVHDGMMRFITEQYAEGLSVGGMLGYVMDGNVANAQTRVDHAITGHAPLNLSGGNSLPTSGAFVRFATGHSRTSGQNIELRHALLAYC